LDSYALDRASWLWSWDVCSLEGSSPAELEIGSRVLTEGELSEVTEALSRLALSSAMDCRLDSPLVLLDVRSGTQVDRYADDVYSGCPWEDQEGCTFATGLDRRQGVFVRLPRE
jgi:hypothetical protein